MSVTEQEWKLESDRLDEVLRFLKRYTEQLERLVGHRREDVHQIRRQFWDNISVNVENADDLNETASSITQQAMVLAERERSHSFAAALLRRLERVLPSPYFGRVDFRESGEMEAERLYIGVASVLDEASGTHLVYDWRAPISSLFYDYPPGPARYATPEGEVSGDMLLKRQYVIRGGMLENVFDTGIQIGDEMLQYMLGRQSDEKMRSIVSTIQREQNLIIRNETYPVLVVQGSAGSGKTSAALQRIAYLLYRYRKTMTADQIVLFSPNELFNDYVSNVLPELGEANMRQTTLQGYLESRLSDSLDLEDAYDQLEGLLRLEEDRLEGRRRAIRFKASLDFARMLDRYLELLKSEGFQVTPFVAKNKVLIAREKLLEWFYSFGQAPIGGRLEKIKEYVLEELKAIGKAEAARVYRNMRKRNDYIGAEPEMKELSKRIVAKHLKPLRSLAKQSGYVDVKAMYMRLFEEPGLASRCAEGGRLPEEWSDVCEWTLAAFRGGKLLYEDAAAYIYFKEHVKGMSIFSRIRHVVVDEAQDYSPLQYALLKKLFPSARVTLLGDLNQSIYAHSGRSAYDSVAELHGREQVGMIRLTKSYRSTKEIVEFTQKMLHQGEPVEAFSRGGEPPRVISVEQERLAETTVQAVRSLRDLGASSVAVICKTAEETESAYSEMKPLLEGLERVKKDTHHFTTGTVVIPAYLAKGLEFDAVIIYDGGKASYWRESERRLFYTACTRALHHLWIMHTGEPSPFIPNIPAAPSGRPIA